MAGGAWSAATLAGARIALAATTIGFSTALILAGCSKRGGEPAAGGTAPALQVSPAPVSFADLDGLWAALRARHRAGRAVLINFWATWCIPCVDELPDLEKLSREFAASGPDFVGVSLDGWVTGDGPETEEKVKTFLARTGVSYANFIYKGDQDPLLSGFDLPGAIPHSILYDRGGRAVTSWNGVIDPEDLRRAVAGLR
jgi:thiol-disulfide isomerase/thioredoxin